jgi:hypothetical protein
MRGSDRVAPLGALDQRREIGGEEHVDQVAGDSAGIVALFCSQSFNVDSCTLRRAASLSLPPFNSPVAPDPGMQVFTQPCYYATRLSRAILHLSARRFLALRQAAL